MLISIVVGEVASKITMAGREQILLFDVFASFLMEYVCKDALKLQKCKYASNIILQYDILDRIQ